jgi:hypothetical protein
VVLAVVLSIMVAASVAGQIGDDYATARGSTPPPLWCRRAVGLCSSIAANRAGSLPAA